MTVSHIFRPVEKDRVFEHFVCKPCGGGLTQAQTLTIVRYDPHFGKGARLYTDGLPIGSGRCYRA
jgi:hypothetical protein